MRNPNRLDSLYDTLKETHKTEFPDWRFGQLMSNFLGWCLGKGKCQDIFFPEDASWETWFKEYVSDMKRR